MDENRVAGTARNLGGKVEEGFGRVVGDTATQARGKLDQVAGSAQDLYGQAKDKASQAADVVQEGASDAVDYVRNLVEERPYTVAFAAFCLGWVIAHVGHNRRDYF
jgi:uncharacterized protein YjbJ (UPF0337 family)